MHSTRHTLAHMVILAAMAALVAAHEQPGAQPATVAVEGAAPLPMAGQASRTLLLGTLELYTVAVYVDGSLADRERLRSPAVAKALRIAVVYEEDLRRRLPLDWRRELVPLVEQQATAHLRGTFAPLRAGDVVLVSYVPDRGTTLRVNDRAVAVAGANHDLMLAFLDHWLGQQPVSEEMKAALLG